MFASAHIADLRGLHADLRGKSSALVGVLSACVSDLTAGQVHCLLFPLYPFAPYFARGRIVQDWVLTAAVAYSEVEPPRLEVEPRGGFLVSCLDLELGTYLRIFGFVTGLCLPSLCRKVPKLFDWQCWWQLADRVASWLRYYSPYRPGKGQSAKNLV